jgi:hypothetical protein
VSRRFIDAKRRTDRYIKAVTALWELLNESDVGTVRRAYAEVVHEKLKEHFQNKYPMGKRLKRSRGVACVGKLLGKRCGQHNYYQLHCETHQPPAADHVELYNRNGKPEVYVSQPYGLSWESLKNLVSFCETHGLEAEIDTGSWHFPDNTLLVEIKKAEEKTDEVIG